MVLTEDLFNSEKSTGKKINCCISAYCCKFEPCGTVLADSHVGCGSGLLHNGTGWRMDDICPEAKINTIIIIIIVSLFAALMNECHNWIFLCRLLLEVDPGNIGHNSAKKTTLFARN